MKNISMIGGIFMTIIVITGCSSVDNQISSKSEEKAVLPVSSENSQTEANTQDNTKQINKNNEKEIVQFKEFSSYEKSGKIWKNIVISSGISQEDLISLAKELHRNDSGRYFHIFDDDAGIEEYMDWDVNYGKVKDKDGKAKTLNECTDVLYCQALIQQQKYVFPFPEEWAKKHEIAMINEILDKGSLKWKISSPLGIEISNL